MSQCSAVPGITRPSGAVVVRPSKQIAQDGGRGHAFGQMGVQGLGLLAIAPMDDLRLGQGLGGRATLGVGHELDRLRQDRLPS